LFSLLSIIYTQKLCIIWAIHLKKLCSSVLVTASIPTNTVAQRQFICSCYCIHSYKRCYAAAHTFWSREKLPLPKTEFMVQNKMHWIYRQTLQYKIILDSLMIQVRRKIILIVTVCWFLWVLQVPICNVHPYWNWCFSCCNCDTYPWSTLTNIGGLKPLKFTVNKVTDCFSKHEVMACVLCCAHIGPHCVSSLHVLFLTQTVFQLV
jgi:hypothetical protein